MRPWEKIGIDLFALNGKEFLVTVDYYSYVWEIDKLPVDTKAPTVINKLKPHLARYGFQDQVVTDNGLQFSSTSKSSPLLETMRFCSVSSAWASFRESKRDASLASELSSYFS